jgi:hypothetical protein
MRASTSAAFGRPGALAQQVIVSGDGLLMGRTLDHLGMKCNRFIS